ncbi:unnamed protein product [Cuscuta campestris]|uniref:Uncharacterized protein n=1 Tax=Cuscuta campestris TaxID=132261 RepID=A0A484LJ01_9ASTE|nr:unnamed protein product [Cuscuta campestris]
MRWHAEHSHDSVGDMCHPCDSEAWKQFNLSNPTFASEVRNVRLGLCTDGFQPFGQSGSQYSCWPVMVTPYNLPYWREFQKHATWDPRIDDSVMFCAWQSKARRRYTDWLSSIRNEKKGTEKVQPLVPQSWKEYWKSPKFLASSKQNKKNRRGGDENAPASATHTGGPLSFRETQARLGKSGKASDLYSSKWACAAGDVCWSYCWSTAAGLNVAGTVCDLPSWLC